MSLGNADLTRPLGPSAIYSAPQGLALGAFSPGPPSACLGLRPTAQSPESNVPNLYLSLSAEPGPV